MTSVTARRPLMRWAWRLFRREWRQQILVLALLTVAVGGTVVGLGVVTNATTALDPRFGNAAAMVSIAGDDPNLASDLARARQSLGQTEIIEDQHFSIPGSVQAGDLRAQALDGTLSRPTLRVASGRYPSAGSEVGVTPSIASVFGLHLGSAWTVAGQTRTVVGIVENPLDLTDQFALVAPGQLTAPDSVEILTTAAFSKLRQLRIDGPVGIESRGNDRAWKRAAAMLVLSTIALLFVGLLAAAGFMVMAQRRLRALGMLGAVGATDRQVRLVMVANGAAAGAVSAVVGVFGGLAIWVAFAPHLSSIAAHRVSRFALPWWAIGASAVLAFLTAVVAAWWPAHSATRIPIVAALSGRPPRPQPAHRFAMLGSALVVLGVTALAFSHQRRTGFILAGILGTAIGMLLLAPLATRALGAVAGRAPVSIRLALRDLARYQARSGAAAAAIGLALGIASTIAIVAAASAATATTPGGTNLSANQLVVYLSADGQGSPVPNESADQVRTAQANVDQIASTVGGSSLQLEEAVDPTDTGVPVRGGQAHGKEGAALVKPVPGPGKSGMGFQFVAPLYVATPAVLAHYGITHVDPAANVLTSLPLPSLSGLVLLAGPATRENGGTPLHPQAANLPRDGSAPNTLITESQMRALGLVAAPASWLITTPHPLTSAQVRGAQHIAATVGLAVESRRGHKSLGQLRTDATAVGVLVALGVLAMTVGLIRSEAAGDMRTLTATGASSSVRRTITGATAGALALVGAVLGLTGAYLGIVAWNRSKLTPLGHVPLANLATILIGMPLIASAASWLLAGREPATLGQRPLD